MWWMFLSPCSHALPLYSSSGGRESLGTRLDVAVVHVPSVSSTGSHHAHVSKSVVSSHQLHSAVVEACYMHEQLMIMNHLSGMPKMSCKDAHSA